MLYPYIIQHIICSTSRYTYICDISARRGIDIDLTQWLHLEMITF